MDKEWRKGSNSGREREGGGEGRERSAFCFNTYYYLGEKKE